MRPQKMPIAVMRARAHEDLGDSGRAGRQWLRAGVAFEDAEDRGHAAECATHAARCYRKWRRQLRAAARPKPEARR
jgi:hypothetical protein